MALDWSQCPEVTRSSDVMSGAWVFKNSRVPVATVFLNIEGGISVDEIPEIFPGITAKQVKAALHFAAATLQQPELVA